MQVCNPQEIRQAHSQYPPNSRVSLEKPLSLRDYAQGCYMYAQNTMFSLEYVDFWPKLYLILYPFLENLTTDVTIIVININGS